MNRKWRIAIVSFAIAAVLAACGGQDGTPEYIESAQSQVNAAQDEEEQTQVQETEAKPDDQKTEESSATVGEENALRAAKDYLEFASFSYDGLIAQLEYEKYSNEEAVYAADHCGADWMEQAAKAAESYLELTAFSRDGLIEQLEFDGFTHEQAIYGVEQNGY